MWFNPASTRNRARGGQHCSQILAILRAAVDSSSTGVTSTPRLAWDRRHRFVGTLLVFALLWSLQALRLNVLLEWSPQCQRGGGREVLTQVAGFALPCMVGATHGHCPRLQCLTRRDIGAERACSVRCLSERDDDQASTSGSNIFKNFLRPFAARLQNADEDDFPRVLRALRNATTSQLRASRIGGITKYGIVAHDCCARHANDGSGDWLVPVQVWIYRKNKGRHSVRLAICQKMIIEMRHGIKDVDPEEQRRYDERGRLIFRNIAFRGGESGKRVEIRLGGSSCGKEWQEVPVETDTQGRLQTEVRVPAAEMQRLATISSAAADGKAECIPLEVRSTRQRGPASARPARGPVSACVRLVEPEGLSVISDIDDTVKVTDVFAGKDAVVRKTFFEEFRAVQGMAELFRKWEHAVPGVSFNFVSNSPPELLEPLRQFLEKEGFPRAPLHLRPLWGMPSAERKSFKADTIEKLIKQMPKRRFVLLGDSGEHDPVIYSDMMRRYPAQVIKVLIREVDPEARVDDKVFDGLPPSSWQVFKTPSEVELPLAHLHPSA